MEIENINISLIFYAAFRNQACEDKFQQLIKEVNLSSDLMIGGKLYCGNFTSTIIKLDFPNFNSDRKRKSNIIYVDRDCNANDKMNGGLVDAILGSPEAEYVKSTRPEDRHYAIFFSRLVDYNIHPSELSELVRVMVETDAMVTYSDYNKVVNGRRIRMRLANPTTGMSVYDRDFGTVYGINCEKYDAYQKEYGFMQLDRMIFNNSFNKRGEIVHICDALYDEVYLPGYENVVNNEKGTSSQLASFAMDLHFDMSRLKAAIPSDQIKETESIAQIVEKEEKPKVLVLLLGDENTKDDDELNIHRYEQKTKIAVELKRYYGEDSVDMRLKEPHFVYTGYPTHETEYNLPLDLVGLADVVIEIQYNTLIKAADIRYIVKRMAETKAGMVVSIHPDMELFSKADAMHLGEAMPQCCLSGLYRFVDRAFAKTAFMDSRLRFTTAMPRYENFLSMAQKHKTVVLQKYISTESGKMEDKSNYIHAAELQLKRETEEASILEREMFHRQMLMK